MSEKKTYAVMGASGHIGSQVTRRLLEAGMEVRAIGRNTEKMKPLTDKGAKFFNANVEDANALAETFKGCTAAFLMIPPPDMSAPSMRRYQNKVADAIVEAIQKSGIQNVVALSSVGAHNAEGVGPVKGLHDFEERLNKLQHVNILILRAAYFMENLFNYIPLIQKMGFAGSAFPGDLPMPMIATRDIGNRVADHLLKLDFKSHQKEYVLGQRDVALKETIQIVGQAIGKNDLKYVEIPPEQAKAGMMQMGISEDIADSFNEMMTSGKLMRPTESRSAANTTPTSIEEFAKTFANRFRELSTSRT